MSLTNIDQKLETIAPEIETIANIAPEEPIHEPEVVSRETVPEQETEPEAAQDTAADDSVDAYGQPVEKKERIYTESEVQQMMRDRNARGEFARQEAERQRQLQQQQQEPQAAEGSEDWQQQLESFVEQTLTKREQKQQQEHWQQQQQKQQAEFEIKFNTGAAKYKDFEQVVVGKSLTPQMVIATRGMDDPAAFIYAAAKTQAQELDRISKINDPYTQAVELGKLDERMKRARNTTSNAPKPIASVKGDAVEKSNKPQNIDDMLRADMAAKVRERR